MRTKQHCAGDSGFVSLNILASLWSQRDEVRQWRKEDRKGDSCEVSQIWLDLTLLLINNVLSASQQVPEVFSIHRERFQVYTCEMNSIYKNSSFYGEVIIALPVFIS